MTDNLEIVRCPACQKEMKKVFDKEKGIYIDICIDGCGGVFFGKKEYENYDEQHENAEVILEALKDRKYTPVSDDIPRICADCNATMMKNFSSSKMQIKIDACYSCGAKFLDNQELEKIRAEFPTAEARQKDFMENLFTIVGEEFTEQIEENALYDKENKKEFFFNGVCAVIRMLSFGTIKLKKYKRKD